MPQYSMFLIKLDLRLSHTPERKYKKIEQVENAIIKQ